MINLSGRTNTFWIGLGLLLDDLAIYFITGVETPLCLLNNKRYNFWVRDVELVALEETASLRTLNELSLGVKLHLGKEGGSAVQTLLLYWKGGLLILSFLFALSREMLCFMEGCFSYQGAGTDGMGCEVSSLSVLRRIYIHSLMELWLMTCGPVGYFDEVCCSENSTENRDYAWEKACSYIMLISRKWEQNAYRWNLGLLIWSNE